jgi:hypothetical protein
MKSKSPRKRSNDYRPSGKRPHPGNVMGGFWLESTLVVASTLLRYSAFKTKESEIKPMRVCKG